MVMISNTNDKRCINGTEYRQASEATGRKRTEVKYTGLLVASILRTMKTGAFTDISLQTTIRILGLTRLPYLMPEYSGHFRQHADSTMRINTGTWQPVLTNTSVIIL